MIHLGNRLGKARLPEFVGAEQAREETSIVLDRFTLYDYQAGQGSRVKLKSRHAIHLSARIDNPQSVSG